MKHIFLILFLTLGYLSQGQINLKNSTCEQLTYKNFYLLQQLNSYQKELLIKDIYNTSFYQSIQKRQQEREELLNQDEWNHKKIVETFLFSEEEINQSKQWLSSRLKSNNQFLENLRSSNNYANFNRLSDKEFIERSFLLCARALNHIIKIYGLGEPPQYAKIDSVAYDPTSDFFKYSVASWAELVHNKRSLEKQLFYQPSLDYAVSLLYMNHKDEAIRYDPLIKHNVKAKKYAKITDVEDYDYSSIIVLGNGPENKLDRLTSLGKLNLQLGVIEFLKGNAPFIIVSGGHVHPFRSAYAEAIEMKKELINVYGIAEKHIIIDPYARHTTTNLRNATRLMLSYGISIQKPSLIVTNKYHSNYTYSNKFMKRSIEELGYKVGKIGKRISNTAIEFYPSELCMQQNPYEPLDP